MTSELKAHEYGKDVNFAGVYSGLVLHGNLHTRMSEYTMKRHGSRIRSRFSRIVYSRQTKCRVNHEPLHSFKGRNLIRNFDVSISKFHSILRPEKDERF